MKLLHIGLSIHSREELLDFYQNILDFHPDYHFDISLDLTTTVFGIEQQAEVYLYSNQSLQLELFVYPEKTIQGFAHVCIEVHDREMLAKKCELAGYPVIRKQREDKPDFLFIKDKAGNVFELKN